MCRIRQEGSTLEVEWESPISDISPVTFDPDSPTGLYPGGNIATTVLGNRAHKLISEWRRLNPTGTVNVPTSKIIRFKYSSIAQAEEGVIALAVAVERHTHVEPHIAAA